MAVEHAIIRDFQRGWNTQDLPAEDTANAFGQAQTPQYSQPFLVTGAAFPQMQNLFVSQQGRLALRAGQHAVTPSLAAPPQGLTRYYNATVARLVIGVNGTVIAYNEAAGTSAALSTGGSAAAPLEFVSFYDRLYWADGVNAPLKWNGLTASAQRVGIVAPAAAPSVAAGGVGLLNDTFTGASPYQYYVTFANTGSGVESNPSPASAAVTLTNQQASLSGIPVSSDPQVNARYIYRVGGSSTAIRYVASLPNNTATTYTDNAPDTSLPFTLLSFVHDAPPATLSFFYFHKNRLFGAGDAANPDRVYFSSYGLPEYWPTYVSNPDVDGGFIDVDPTFGDPIVGYCSTGSLLVIARARSLYVMLGDTFSDFVIRKVSGYGCVARRSLVRCLNQVLLLGPDGMVYALADDEPKAIALPLEKTLKTLTAAELAGACACYNDQRYELFIPRASGASPVNIAYDFRVGAWTDLSDPALGATAVYAAQGLETSGEVLLATKPGYPGGYNGVVSAFGKSDQGQSALPLAWETPGFEFGRPTFTKRGKTLKLEGTLTIPNGGALPTATVYAKTPGRPDISRTYPLTATTGKLLERGLHADLIGRQLSVVVTGAATAFELNTLDLGFVYLREAY